MLSEGSPTKKRKCFSTHQLHAGGTHDEEQRKIVFSSSYMQREFKLLEVSSALLESILSSESNLRLVGARGSEALLCTDNKTFAMKKVETSNAVLFVPASSDSVFTIETAVSEYFEVSPVAGKLDLLHEVLQQSVYPSSGAPATLYTLEMLLSTVPASRAEIVSALCRAGAVEVDGLLRTVCRKAQADTLRALMQTAIAQQWDLDSRQVQEGECLAALEATSLPADPVVLQSVLRSLSATESRAAGTEAQVVRFTTPAGWLLDQRKVRAATARLLFAQPPVGQKGASAGPVTWALQDFLLEWSLVTPGLRSAGSEDLVLLRGIAVATDGGQLVHLPAEALAGMDAKARLAALFALRERYLLEELEPYLADLLAAQGTPKTCAELLVQHARSVQDGSGGAVVYCCK